jgi:hypothetical protein
MWTADVFIRPDESVLYFHSKHLWHQMSHQKDLQVATLASRQKYPTFYKVKSS